MCVSLAIESPEAFLRMTDALLLTVEHTIVDPNDEHVCESGKRDGEL